MPPYLAKVVRLGQDIVLVDAFAGPGLMSGGRHGSPLIICDAAEKFASGQYRAYFFNNDPNHHEQLSAMLRERGYTSALPIFGDAIEQLNRVIEQVGERTLFIYIDPYGLSCEFDVLSPLLSRNRNYSTEILINLPMPITHRLGSRSAIQSERADDRLIQSYHAKLTRVFGGDYWKDVLLQSEFDTAKDREKRLIQLYRQKLSSSGYLKYTGACPVRETTDSATKYFMVFASRHPDSMLLFNDEMCKSYNQYMHEQDMQDTLFATLTWQDWRDPLELQDIILNRVRAKNDATRRELWLEIVEDHFMHFTSSEYNAAVRNLRQTRQIECFHSDSTGDLRPATRINDDTILRLGRQKALL